MIHENCNNKSDMHVKVASFCPEIIVFSVSNASSLLVVSDNLGSLCLRALESALALDFATWTIPTVCEVET